MADYSRIGGLTRLPFPARGPKPFRMEFPVSESGRVGEYGGDMADDARKIALDELYDFTKAVQPLVRRYAPYKEGGKANLPDFMWSHAGRKHLRDTIRAQRDLRNVSATLTMLKRAQYTLYGRGGRAGRAIPIQLPGGVLIFRNKIDPATTHRENRSFHGDYFISATGRGHWYTYGAGIESGHDGAWRMEWAKRADQEIRKRKLYEQVGKNIAIRLWLEVEYPRLVELFGAKLANEAMLVRKHDKNLTTVAENEGHHYTNFAYRPLNRGPGRPKASAYSDHKKYLHRVSSYHKGRLRSVSPHHSQPTSGSEAARTAARRTARLHQAQTLERLYGQHTHIPLGRRR